MDWFRHNRHLLIHLTLGVWVLAVAVAAFQGCLGQADHDPVAAHPVFSSQLIAEGHVPHASGCLKFCDDSANGLKPATQILSFDIAGMAILLLLPVLTLFDPAEKIVFSALAVWRHVTSGPPARLRFARLND